jgi:tRNA G18 (ribose-2'-O)-methylase SpoU
VFKALPRRPIQVVLDNIRRGYNIGAIIRLCDAMLIEKLTICGVTFDVDNKRKITQAAQGTQHWVPISQCDTALDVITEAKNKGYQIVIGELTNNSIAPFNFSPKFPICLVLGSERHGVSPNIIKLSDVALAIPMYGMANSLNVSTAAAILLYQLTLKENHHG